MLGRIQVQPDHVAEFLDELLVAAELESFEAMGLQSVRFPDALDGHLGDAQVLGEGAGAPRGGRPGLLVKRCIEDALDEFSGERRFASGARLIAESVEAGLGEALSPQDDGLAVDAESAGNGVVRQPLRTAQNNVRSQDHFLPRIAASNEATKSVSLRSGEG